MENVETEKWFLYDVFFLFRPFFFSILCETPP